ncbi:MAG: hypothetical protein K2W80_11355 [Burkholderiales bacterium]|nr:hypothetical protein [Burkholderiales bacterium]
MITTVPIRTGTGMNAREHHMARSRRVKQERRQTGLVLLTCTRPQLPCTVLLTRIAPSNGLDDDNLAGALKGVRDQIAEWLGVDDRHRDRVAYRYAQERGKWGVRIEFQPAGPA